MATAEQIAALRAMIAEPVNAEPYSDATLSALIDAALGDLNSVAKGVWVAKAASYTTMVDVSEGGSQRKMGDLQDHALKMVRYYQSQIPDGAEPVTRSTRVAKLRRP